MDNGRGCSGIGISRYDNLISGADTEYHKIQFLSSCAGIQAGNSVGIFSFILVSIDININAACFYEGCKSSLQKLSSESCCYPSGLKSIYNFANFICRYIRRTEFDSFLHNYPLLCSLIPLSE